MTAEAIYLRTKIISDHYIERLFERDIFEQHKLLF